MPRCLICDDTIGDPHRAATCACQSELVTLGTMTRAELLQARQEWQKIAEAKTRRTS